MKLLLMGVQGSGKGTAAEKLSEIYNIPTISVGDLFREVISSGNELGKQLKEIIDAGNLVSDDLTAQILNARLNEEDCKDGYILDGYPRTMNQAILLKQITDIDKVVFLDVNFDIVTDRILGRRTCPKCNHIHNLKYPGDPEFCSICGTKYIVRSDDTESAVKKRLQTFAEKTLPIVDYYKNQGLVITVDASKNPEHTLKQIIEGLKKL